MTENRFSYAHGSNVDYIEDLYSSYQKNPEAIDPSWRKFFEGYEFALASGQKPTATQQQSKLENNKPASELQDNAKVEAMINAYRRLGHLSADLDPLDPRKELAADILPAAHGLHNIEAKRLFHPSNFGSGNNISFNDILKKLEATYCSYIGADFRELNDVEAVTWLQEQMEACNNHPSPNLDTKKRILQKLAEAEGFERFLQARYLGQKKVFS